MTKPARAQLRLHPALVSAIIAICVATIIWLLSFSPWKIIPFKLAGQAYVMIAILLAFRYWPPMIRFVSSMPVVHRVVFGVLLAAMIGGHYTLNGRTYFPFVVWEIFPFLREDDPVTCPEFIGTTADGTRVRLIAEQLFPSIVQINPVASLSPGTTGHLALAMAKEYNALHPKNPVRQVELMLMSVQLHPPANESHAQPSCELLKRYDVSSDH